MAATQVRASDGRHLTTELVFQDEVFLLCRPWRLWQLRSCQKENSADQSCGFQSWSHCAHNNKQQEQSATQKSRQCGVLFHQIEEEGEQGLAVLEKVDRSLVTATLD
jgi:hypothetical protein